MPSGKRPKIEILQVIGEGNYLQKSRRNFFISNRCWDLLHQISLEMGLSHSGCLELAVREMYQRMYGTVPPIPLRTKRREDA